ncbi:mitotubule-associated protein Gb4 [Trypanosoma theileri]|uniref:Mitotubule-associated protein Gb4 n=1 Tax=Trypanosoma theileri TaxID=67003 RepID=A0A1X0P7F9_9TRYP|nr:mitotubule-associated protein Gb4 [Trypanosoma theileri]ORC92864.1 mitotubule-associated protein Gb4 [Trypanosoma theileri]
MSNSDEGLLVDFGLRHPTTLAEADVNADLKACKYKTLWELYEERMVETTHELGFDGEDWEYVVEQHPKEVEEAVASETARALKCEREDVTRVDLDPAPQGLIAFVTVQHSPQLKEEQIMDTLQQCEYKAVWALYVPRVGPTDASASAAARSAENTAGVVDDIVTAHHVGFEGPGWENVLVEKRKDLLQAFVYDTAKYLSVDNDDILDVVMSNSDEGLLVDFGLRHPTTLAEADVNADLKACEYETLWELYDEGMVRTTQELGFEGEDWEYVVQQHPKEVEEAVASETARALKCEREDVTRVELDPAPQGLIAFVTVQHLPSMSEDVMRDLLRKYPFKEVWALYDIPISRSNDAGNEGSKSADSARRRAKEAFFETTRAEADLLEAEEEARRLEAVAEAALREARHCREASLKASESARQKEEAAVLQLLEVASSAADAAVRAEAFAEWSRRQQKSNIINAGEEENETEQLTYLRNALAQARRERDEYRDLLEEERYRREKTMSDSRRRRVSSEGPA